MPLLAETSWSEIETLRERVSNNLRGSPTIVEAANRFLGVFTDEFSSIALARLFLVVPYSSLPREEAVFAEAIARQFGGASLRPETPVLSLVGTRGAEAAWNDRKRSKGHLAIPLLDKKFVEGAPMIAQLLADLEIDLAALGDGRPIASRRMLGGHNQRFYVADAEAAQDDRGRYVIADQAFVATNAIRTVFGMAGAYADGVLAVAIIFSRERLDELAVDRFPSFISHFKMSTSDLVRSKCIYAAA